MNGSIKGTRNANGGNMPMEPSLLRVLEIEESGIHKKERLKFKYNGQWFWLPSAWEAEIKEHVFGKTDVVCIFRWGASGFVCSIHPTSNYPPCSAATSKQYPIYVGNIYASGDIPVSFDGHEIETGGFVQRKGEQPSCFLALRGFCERFWIPRSLSQKLFALAKTKCSESIDPINYKLSFLATCRLVKPDNDKIGVPGLRNSEHRMWIREKDSNNILLQQLETSRSMVKREGRHGSVDTETKSKRQRI
jgi:hypothetical protein